MAKIILALGLFLATATTGFAASFDCEKPLSKTEALICSDEKISDLDVYLANMYKTVLRIAKNKDQEKLEQKRWIASVRDACQTSATCLSKAYDDRIAALEKHWTVRRAQLDQILSSKALIPNKPFEGMWAKCSILNGEELCLSQILIQEGKNICVEWSEWATYTTYTGQLQAIATSPDRAEITYKCGDSPDIASIKCKNENELGGGWEKGDDAIRIVNNKIAGYYQRFPLSKEYRKNLVAQTWVKECLAGVKLVIKPK